MTIDLSLPLYTAIQRFLRSLFIQPLMGCYFYSTQHNYFPRNHFMFGPLTIIFCRSSSKRDKNSRGRRTSKSKLKKLFISTILSYVWCCHNHTMRRFRTHFNRNILARPKSTLLTVQSIFQFIPCHHKLLHYNNRLISQQFSSISLERCVFCRKLMESFPLNSQKIAHKQE